MSNSLKETVLGPDVSFKGEVSLENPLRIEGQFQGRIVSKGSIYIGRDAAVTADLNVGSAEIAGKVKGNISALDRIRLFSSASLHGNIKSSKLIIDEGSTFVGASQVETSGKR